MTVWIPLLQKTGLTPNQLYLIWCLGSNAGTPMNINIHTELRVLKNEGLCDANGKLTPAGLQILDFIPKSKLPKIKVELTEDMVGKYLEIFPKKKLPSGKMARADKRNIKVNFEWFFKTYKYDWETVIQATKLYVDEYEAKNYMYMKTSQYFISKMNPDKSRESELANYCSMIVNNDYEDSSNFFSDKVV